MTKVYTMTCVVNENGWVDEEFMLQIPAESVEDAESKLFDYLDSNGIELLNGPATIVAPEEVQKSYGL